LAISSLQGLAAAEVTPSPKAIETTNAMVDGRMPVLHYRDDDVGRT
jgi:hypothetical protein